METTTEQTAAQRADAAIKDLGLSIGAQFVPFSKSRNAEPREDGKVWRSLNWRVTLYKAVTTRGGDADTRAILTADYSAGEGHCPAAKASVAALGNRNSVMRDKAIAYECETGRTADYGHIRGMVDAPLARDVLYSLVSDADVLDCGTFEEWAINLGYDPDSRKAESIYRACLEIALKLRNGIGEDGLAKLREAFQDY